MAKKIKTLTREELCNIIAESVMQVMNENDAKIYAKVHESTNQARKGNRSGIHQVDSNKSETDDFIIAHGIDMKSKATGSFMTPYKDINYMFYCKNLRQNVGITMFKLEQLHELTSEKAVLIGEIIFNNQQMTGSIIVNLNDGQVNYYHSSSKRKYLLEIDKRFECQWNNLVQKLQQVSNLI